jgi:hypothetical protein
MNKLLAAALAANIALTLWLATREIVVRCELTQYYDDSRIYARIHRTTGKIGRGYVVCSF